jgi:hypothetical protein
MPFITHLAYDSAVVEHSTNYVTLFVYLWPVAAGGVLVFFMVKPILAGRPEQPPRYSLTPQSDPELFALITHICKLVRAPLPSRVDVDCQINASASFRRGLLSMPGNDVVLTIGLPLAAGLSMQEFAGVLAHEFGHFAQGAGMKLTYIIRAISGWFARVVYERDEWDCPPRPRRTQCGYPARRLRAYDPLCGLGDAAHSLGAHGTSAISSVASCFGRWNTTPTATKPNWRQRGIFQDSEKFQKLIGASQVAYKRLDESWKGRRLPQNPPSFIKVA